MPLTVVSFTFQEDISQVAGQGMVAGQQKALECPSDDVRNFHFRFCSTGMVCIINGIQKKRK